MLKHVNDSDVTSFVCVCVCFPGKRTAQGIIQWLKRRAGSGTPVLDSADSAAQYIDSHNITVVGFFDVRLSILSILIYKSSS